MAIFQVQREVFELNLQLLSINDRLTRLQRVWGFTLHMSAERGIPPEGVQQAINSFELLDRELLAGQRDIKRCRELMKPIFKSLGYTTLPEVYGLDDD